MLAVWFAQTVGNSCLSTKSPLVLDRTPEYCNQVAVAVEALLLVEV